MAKKILLVDTSHLLFRAYYAFPKNLTDPEKKPINAVYGVAQMLMSIIESQKPTHIFAAQDLPTKTKRSEKMEAYKAQRPPLAPDLREQIPRIYEMIQAMNISVVSENGYEADDVIATIAEHFRGNDETQVCILTGDQDAFQLIGENVVVLRPIKNDLKIYTAGILMAEKSLFPQYIPDFKALAGDPSDNMKGVEGIGEKTATSLIEKYGSLEQIYEALEKGEIVGKQKEKLETGKEIAFFTREMATLYKNAPLEHFIESNGAIEQFSVEGACAFFSSIGSNSLQRRVRSIFQTPMEKKEDTSVQSLF